MIARHAGSHKLRARLMLMIARTAGSHKAFRSRRTAVPQGLP